MQPLKFEVSHSSVFETSSIHMNSYRILHCVRYIFFKVSKTQWPFQVSEIILIAPSESEPEGINFVNKKKAQSLMFITKNTHLNIILIH